MLVHSHSFSMPVQLVSIRGKAIPADRNRIELWCEHEDMSPYEKFIVVTESFLDLGGWSRVAMVLKRLEPTAFMHCNLSSTMARG